MLTAEVVQPRHKIKKPELKKLDAVILDLDKTITPSTFHSIEEFTRAMFKGQRQECADANWSQISKIYFSLYRKHVLDTSNIHTAQERHADTQKAIEAWLRIWREAGCERKADVEEITHQIVQYAIDPETYPLVEFFRDMDIPVAIVTAAYQEFAMAVADRLGITEVRSNPKFKYRDGDIVGMDYNIQETQRKKRQIQQVIYGYGTASTNVLVLDDNPKELAHHFAVATINNPDPPESAWRNIDQLYQVVPHLLPILTRK